MTFEKRVNKQKAIALRKLGWKYQDIAKELECSKEWCCANLKGIEPDLKMMRDAYQIFVSNGSLVPNSFHDQVSDLAEILEWSEDDYPCKVQ